MNYKKRLDAAFQTAPTLPILPTSKFVFMSDCHRGVGNSNDNFLKNQNIFFAALNYYYKMGYTYIEIGDGDELWENSDITHIKENYSNIYWLLSLFAQKKSLYLLFGNHDLEKKFCDSSDFSFFEGILLEDSTSHKVLHLTHGHQAEPLNSTFWRLARFLVRFLWKPLEQFGVLNPTSAAKNHSVKEKTERRLEEWAKEHHTTIISGHTHRPVLDIKSPHYCNTGNCVHPRCITCIELQNSSLVLVKWAVETREDLSLVVKRTVLSGPIKLKDLNT